ncbi:MAG: hypothetical protein RLN86_01000 [Cyclobacteriaceae bacterium]
MALRSLLAFVSISVVSHVLLAQSGSALMSAEGAGVGYSTAALTKEWSLFNNIGGLSEATAFTSIFAYEVNPNLQGANRAAAGIVMPFKFVTTGLGLFRFGDDLYNEQMLSLGLSNRFGLGSLGIKINYIQYSAEGFGTHSAVGIDFGGIAELSKNFSIGAYIINLNQPKLKTVDEEKLPVKLTVGFRFRPSEKTSISSEVQKDIVHKPTIRAGVEFSIYKKIQFRAGANLNPTRFFSGIGYSGSRLKIDYALQFNPDMNVSHQASVGYLIKPRK